MSTGPVELQGITINAGILETLQGFSTQRNVLKGITIAVGTGASIMQLKVVDRNHEPIEGATCRVLNAILLTTNVLSFDGVDDRLVFNSAIPFNIGYSVSMYINFFQVNSTQYFISAISGTTGVRYSGDNFLVFLGGSGWTTLNWTKVDRWVHFVLQRINANTYKIIIDNVEIGTLSSNSTATLNIQQLARRSDGYYFKGPMSDIRVYNYILTSADINTIMTQRATVGETGLLNYHKLDEGTGTTSTDSAGSNNGTIYGATWAEVEDLPIETGIAGYDPTPYDSQTTNANGLTTLNYQINTIHGLEVTLPGKRRFIMPFERTARGLLDWQVMLSDYIATFATDRGNILINSEPENNDSNFLIE